MRPTHLSGAFLIFDVKLAQSTFSALLLLAGDLRVGAR